MFFSIFDQEAVGIAQIDTKTGQFLRVNQRYCEITGYSQEEVTATTFMELTHADDLQAELDNMKQLVEGKIDRFSMEKRYIHKDGSIVWINLSVSPNWNKGEEPDYHIAVIEDITKRKKAEEELKESVELFSNFFDHGNIGAVITSLEKGFIQINKKFQDLLGYSAPELKKKTWPELTHPEDLNEDLMHFNEILAGTIDNYELDKRFLRKDGSILYSHITVSCIHNSDGSPKYALATIQDITSRKLSEEKLRDSIFNLKESVKAGHVGLWNWDLISNEASFSPEWKKQIGYEENEISNHFFEWENRLHPDDLKQALDLVKESVEKVDQNHRSEFRFRHKDGSYRWIFAQASFILNAEGQPIRMVGSHLDITDQKQAEEEKSNLLAQLTMSDKMASIGQLAAGVAHEINNPVGFINSNLNSLHDYLSNIKGLMELYDKLLCRLQDIEAPVSITDIKDKIESLSRDMDVDFILEDIDDLVRDCMEGTNRIKNIVNSLKDFAHTGKEELDDFDINIGIESTLNVISYELRDKTEVTKDLGDLPFIKAVPQHLNQVFLNILVNAVYAMDEIGKIGIKTWHKNDHIYISISDTGCGISKENIKKIFDPFFTTKEVGEGTGLGMNIAYNIIKKYKGDIAIESNIGEGTTFTISLPVTAKLDSNN